MATASSGASRRNDDDAPIVILISNRFTMQTDLDRLNQVRNFTKSLHAELLRQKGVIPPITTSNASALQSEGRAFATVLARQTVLGRLAGTIPAPPFTPVPTPQTEPTPQWVVEGNPIPVGKIDFSAPRTSISKFAVIVAFSDEVVRTADDRGLNLIQLVTIRYLRGGEDVLLLSDTAAVSLGNPAGLLYGLAVIGDGSPATLVADFDTLWSDVPDGDPVFPYFVMSPRGAMYLASLNENGSPLFPNVSPATGGNIYGVPVLLTKAAGAKVVLIDAGRLAVTDNGLE